MGLGLHTDRREGGSDGGEGGLHYLSLHSRRQEQGYLIHYTRNIVLLFTIVHCRCRISGKVGAHRVFYGVAAAESKGTGLMISVPAACGCFQALFRNPQYVMHFVNYLHTVDPRATIK